MLEKTNASSLIAEKMKLDEYNKEDLSRIINLVKDYERVRGSRRTPLDYEKRLEVLADAVIDDPRGYAKLPHYFLTKGNYQAMDLEFNTFQKKLFEKANADDLRGKVERMMYKPSGTVYFTEAEKIAYNLFSKVSNLEDIDKYAVNNPDLYFGIYDKIYQGHKALMNLDAEKSKFGDVHSAEFQKSYLRKVADIVIKYPQVFEELPPQIKDDYTPPNDFYERMLERLPDLEKSAEEIARKRAKGGEVTRYDIAKERLLKPLDEYVNFVEKHAEEILERLEATHDDDLDIQDLYGENALGMTDEEMAYFAKRTNYEVTQADLDAFYGSVSDEDVPIEAYFEETLPGVEYERMLQEEYGQGFVGELGFNDDLNFKNLMEVYGPELVTGSQEGFVPNKEVEDQLYDIDEPIGIEIDENDVNQDAMFIFRDSDRMQDLGDEWYELSDKPQIKKKDIERMVEIEGEMASLVIGNPSLYIAVPAKIANPMSDKSAFYERIIDQVGDEDIASPLLEDDLSRYEMQKNRWKDAPSDKVSDTKDFNIER